MFFDVGDEGVDRRLHPLEHRLRVDPQEDDSHEERHQDEALAQREVGHFGVGALGWAVEHPLVSPEQVDGRNDHAAGGDDSPPTMGGESTHEGEELADEAVESGETDRREHHDHEHGRQDRRRLLETAQLGDFAGVATLVDHPDEEEQGAGGEAVVDHLEQPALESLRC